MSEHGSGKSAAGVFVLLKEQELLFVGSKERFKRSIVRQEGEILDGCRFRLLWRSAYFRRGLTFRIRGRYEKAGEGYLLRYRFAPTLPTVFWISLPILVCLGFAVRFFLAGDSEAAGAISLFSVLYPAVALWQAVRCHREFRRTFQIPTG